MRATPSRYSTGYPYRKPHGGSHKAWVRGLLREHELHELSLGAKKSPAEQLSDMQTVPTTLNIEKRRRSRSSDLV
jgi:hypothetical protein